jgi:hypothetical protein
MFSSLHGYHNLVARIHRKHPSELPNQKHQQVIVKAHIDKAESEKLPVFGHTLVLTLSCNAKRNG